MTPLVVVGVVVGVTLLVNLPRNASMLSLGAFVLLYGLWSLCYRGVPRVVSQRWAYPAGFLGGITGMLFGAGGPPYVVYLAHRGLSKEQFRSTLTLAAVFSITVRLIAMAFAGLLFRREVWLAAMFVVPAALLGVSLASHLFRHISRELLLRLVTLLLLASGTSLIARAVG